MAHVNTLPRHKNDRSTPVKALNGHCQAAESIKLPDHSRRRSSSPTKSVWHVDESRSSQLSLEEIRVWE